MRILTRSSAVTFALATAAALPAPAAVAQGDPACAPGNALVATFTAHESGRRAPLVATHEMVIRAEWNDVVRNPALSLPDGVRALGQTGRTIRLIVPAGASVAVTATWQQAIDPTNPDHDPSDPATRCSATQTTALPVTATLPGRAVYGLTPGGESDGVSIFAVVPDPGRGDHSPLEVSVRVAGSARFPAASARARTMPVAMRPSERVRYRKRIPNADLLSTPQRCRFYSLICDRATRVFTDVGFLGARSPNRAIRKRDLVHSGALSRVQPFRQVAPYGVRISTVIFGQPRHEPPAMGYDIQVHQSGRLVARVRRAMRCGKVPNGFGERFYRCRVVRRQNG